MNIGSWLASTDARPHSPVTVTEDPGFESVRAEELGMVVSTDLTSYSPATREIACSINWMLATTSITYTYTFSTPTVSLPEEGPTFL